MKESVKKPQRVCAASPDSVLPGAGFSDAYAVDARAEAGGAPEIGARIFGSAPVWVSVLMRARNALVSPLGLKSAPKPESRASQLAFPVVESSANRVVLGLDDRHLDFRVVIDVEMEGDFRRVTATTHVLTHNLLGAAYLAAVLPFHKLIVPSLLARAVRPA